MPPSLHNKMPLTQITTKHRTLSLSFLFLSLLLCTTFPRPSSAFLGRGTLLEKEGDVFGIYCSDFDRNTRVWHHREITREAVRRAVVDYFKDVTPASGTYNHRDGMTLEEAYAEYYGSSASPKPFLHALASIVDSVAEADSGQLGLDPRYHFGSERFSESQSVLTERWRRIVNAGRAGDYTAARHLLGLSLAALQDFYSRTNWVELDHEQFSKDIGLSGRNFPNVAKPQDSTCRDCPEGADGEGSCRDNLLGEVVEGGTLTSGYTEGAWVNGRRVGKPKGVDKCSHGGPRDASRTQGARGGINKDLPTACFSPHHHLHHQAAQQAVESSKYYLTLLRGSLGQEAFSRLLSLPPSAPALVLVVDTTESMEGQLEALKHSMARLVKQHDSHPHPPSQYILVPFNDPLYGPVIKSTRPDQIYSALSRLTTFGGGDEAELSMSALSLALHHAPPLARVYLFTDASIKDPELFPSVLTMALHKEVTITPVLTRPVRFGGFRGRFDLDLSAEYREEEEDREPADEPSEPDTEYNRSSRPGNRTGGLRDPRSRVKRQLESMSQYRELARRTGGRVVEATEDRLSDVTSILETTLEPQAVLWQEWEAGADRRIKFPVDSLVKEFQVAVSGEVSTATLRAPSGVTFDLKSQVGSQEQKGFEVEIFTPFYIQGRINLAERDNKDYGDWTLRLSHAGSSPVSALVTALSPLDLLPALYSPDHSAAQPSLQRILGQPALGTETYLNLALSGVDTAGLRKVDRGHLTGENGAAGAALPSLPTTAPRRNTYLRLPSSSSSLPSEPFTVSLEGVDGKGHRFRRESEGARWESSNAHITFPLGRDIWGPPGASLRVPIIITSTTTNPGTLFLTAHEARGIPVTLDRTSVNLGRNESVTVLATLPLDPQTPSPSTTTLTFSATSNNGRTARSLAHVSLVPTADDRIPPTCELSMKTSCAGHHSDDTCSSKIWTATMIFRDDTGIFMVESFPYYDFQNFAANSLSLTLSYKATCCQPYAIVTVTDRGGNTGICDINNSGQDNTTNITGLSTGAIAGIAVGAVLLAVLLIALVAFLVIRKRRTGKEEVAQVRRQRRLSTE